MKNKPSYALDSVDNALLLVQMLRDQGRLRVRQAAEDLGIAPSTAHRLLAMLVYRDFARQDEHRCYVPGPGLSAHLVGGSAAQRLRRALLPSMDVLCDRIGETVNLMVRVGTQTRFLASVESTQTLHIGDRRGTILPAALSSGGKALLAELDREELANLYLEGGAEALTRPVGDLTEDTTARTTTAPACGEEKLSLVQFHRFVRELDAIRERGYGFNLEETESGVSAIGRCVLDATGEPVAAIVIAVPSVRFTKDRIPGLVAELRRTTEHARLALGE
ncbi:IclR family transcriptional regulator [Streptosporangium sp. 'caverna']|uniref:IclR family transcriptional regulator n=1 Tax=Streptosporangium sp. 'caverna' TaxID=2202249 RepID=UPI000D7E43D1|nr:IclR family transcriptional regulator [Streptosporangium sp. 'caverna']AWS41402.1 IclR family transcriptional regulator [Streptosporangium sp. 'caverna']